MILSSLVAMTGAVSDHVGSSTRATWVFSIKIPVAEVFDDVNISTVSGRIFLFGVVVLILV